MSASAIRQYEVSIIIVASGVIRPAWLEPRRDGCQTSTGQLVIDRVVDGRTLFSAR